MKKTCKGLNVGPIQWDLAWLNLILGLGPIFQLECMYIMSYSISPLVAH